MSRPAFLSVLLLAAGCAVVRAQTQPLIVPDVSSFDAFVGQFFSVQFSVQNPPAGATASGWSIVQGAPPAGLSFTSAGLLLGVPATPQTASFTVSITYTFPPGATFIPPLVLTRTYQFNADNQLRILTASPLPPATAGTPVNYVIAASMPASWSYEVSDLPPGITVNLPQGSSTMSITGIFPPVTAPATYSIDLYAYGGTYVFQSDNRLFRITVNPAPSLSGPAPSAVAGTPYSSALAVSGGTAPFTFAIASGSLPAGLSLNPSTGAISGTPSSPGQYSFLAAVTDANGATASGSFVIQVAPPPLTISTASLPAGLAGTPYSAALAAAGGVPPYSWAVTAGSLPPGLSLDAGGALAGQPSAAGQFSFTVAVTDSAGSSASRAFTLRIFEPLRILTSALPEGTEGLAYSASIEAAGGAPPYAFSLASGALPAGLALSPAGVLSGTPAEAGDFLLLVRVTDSAKFAAEQPLRLRLHPRPAILTDALPDGRAGEPYRAALAGQGRAPLSWSVSSGSLPPGLVLDSQTGVLSGTPSRTGAFTFQVVLSDGNQPPLSASREFTLRIVLPPLPNLTVTQIEDTAPPASQPSFGLVLDRAYPLELNGTATLSFTPDGDLPPDPAIRFASGGTSVNFTIPAGQTSAVPASGGLLAFQTGTTAGTITLRVVLRYGQTVLDPDPFLVRTIRIPPSGPVITNVTIVRTATGFEVRVTGFSNIRQISGAVFRFTPAPGASLGTAEVSVPVAPAFQTWFGSQESRQYGGQFLLAVPFTVQGSMGSLLSLQVTLSNSAGSGTGAANF